MCILWCTYVYTNELALDLLVDDKEHGEIELRTPSSTGSINDSSYCWEKCIGFEFCRLLIWISSGLTQVPQSMCLCYILCLRTECLSCSSKSRCIFKIGLFKAFELTLYLSH